MKRNIFNVTTWLLPFMFIASGSQAQIVVALDPNQMPPPLEWNMRSETTNLIAEAVLTKYNEATANGDVLVSINRSRRHVTELQEKINESTYAKAVESSGLFPDAAQTPAYVPQPDLFDNLTHPTRYMNLRGAPQALDKLKTMEDLWIELGQTCEAIDPQKLAEQMYWSEPADGLNGGQIQLPLKIIIPIWQKSAEEHFANANATKSMTELQKGIDVLATMIWQIENRPNGYVLGVDSLPPRSLAAGTVNAVGQEVVEILMALGGELPSLREGVTTETGYDIAFGSLINLSTSTQTKMQLDTPLQQKLFYKYWNGNGSNHTLSEANFNEIIRDLDDLAYTETAYPLKNGEMGFKREYDFAASDKYDNAFNKAIVFYDLSGAPVGFCYNYNTNPVDKTSDELLFDAKAFKVQYGTNSVCY